jgi:hypothetical protein
MCSNADATNGPHAEMTTGTGERHGRDRNALLIVEQYPAAYRLAVGLSGTMAGVVLDRVLRRAVAVASRWGSALAAERWILRFTVLASRQFGRAAGDEAGLDWLGPLPVQQREAVVLRHGLGLDLHRMSAAMDCSSTAASNHLVAAMAGLQVAGVGEDQITALPGRLAALVPPPAVLSGEVRQAVARHRWRVLARRWAVAVIVLIGLAGAAWVGWRLWRMIVI